MTSRWLHLLPVSLILAACGGDSPHPDDELLEPPPAGQGLQLTMSTEIAAGVEGEWCQFVVASDDELWIQRDEVRFTTGSHHFLLYETAYDTIPTQTDDGRPVDTSGVFDCSNGPTDGWSITKLIGGSQNGDGESILAFPEGVAMRVRPGAVLLMNAHYLNASPDTLEPRIAINLWTTPAADVQEEGDVLFLYNPVIKVPSAGTGRARWRCPVQRDITLVNVQSHMHKRGVGYAAMIEGEAPFYENDQWADVPVVDVNLQVPAGSRFDYYCDYSHTEARDVYQGPRSTDEMCMLIGSYYPADPATANCLDQDFRIAGEWVGNGTATCATTLGCLQTAFEAEDVIGAITDCMDEVDPRLAAPSSAVLACVMSSADPFVDCAAQIEACQGT
jgi:hypothetical protein